MGLADVVDTALELPIVPSFTRLGADVRSRTDHWTPLASYELSGRTVAITGPTSGLGRAAAGWFARLGADVVLIGRDADRTQRVADELQPSAAGRMSVVCADLGDLDAVAAAATTIAETCTRLDVLVHNAGALSAVRALSPQGLEATVASQVVGPHLLTTRLVPLLRTTGGARVLTMSSGGMYAAPLTVDGLQMGADEYRGAEQYARAKRAQVTMNELWAERVPVGEIAFHAVHPGWADTPGVAGSLPTFRRVVGPLLRTVDQGADTLVWLAADPTGGATTGGFWLDRRRRPIHRLPTTRRSDTARRRHDLWHWCEEHIDGY